MEPLLFLYPIVVLFSIGLIVAYFCRQYKLPVPLLILVTGIVFGKLGLPAQVSQIPTPFIWALAATALVMVSYDTFSRMRLHKQDSSSLQAMHVTGVMYALGLVFIAAVLVISGFLQDIWYVIIASACIACVSSPWMGFGSLRIRNFLKEEAVYSEAAALIIAGLIMQFFIFSKDAILTDSFLLNMSSYSLQIIFGLGTGVVIGLIVFKLFRKATKAVSPIALIAICLTCYTVAELMNASGLFAIIALAILYGGFTIKHRQSLEEFSKNFAMIMEMMILLVLGVVVSIPLNLMFFVFSFIAFVVYLLIRYFSIKAVMNYFTHKDILKMCFAAPKGVGTAVIAVFAFTTVGGGVLPALQVVVAVMLYSQALSYLLHKVEV